MKHEDFIVSMKGIQKSFGGVHALTDGELTLRKGEVLPSQANWILPMRAKKVLWRLLCSALSDSGGIQNEKTKEH